MSATSLVFAPHLPWWLLAAAGRAGAGPGRLWPSGAARAAPAGAPSSWPSCSCSSPTRSCAARSAQPLDDLVLLLSDRSPSQGLADRPAQLAEAEAALRERLGRMPGVELREVDARRREPPGHAACSPRLAARRWPRATARGWVPSSR